MGRYDAIPEKFKTTFEKEWDRAHQDAVKAMRDPNSDETQALCEAAVDDPSDLQALAAFWVKHRDAAACERFLSQLFDRHVERVANDEADKACETVPGEAA
jgi:hypothetical protein